jgi:hypothetical protein
MKETLKVEWKESVKDARDKMCSRNLRDDI